MSRHSLVFFVVFLAVCLVAHGAENIFQNDLTAPAGALEAGVPTGWVATNPSPEMAAQDYVFAEDTNNKQDNGAPFARLTINDEQSVLVLKSHKIPIPHPGDYRFSIKLDNTMSTSVGITFEREPPLFEDPIVISEAPQGVNVYPNKMSAEIMNKDFPSGSYHEIVIYLTIPAGVDAMVVGLHCFRNPNAGDNTMAFGDVKLEEEKN